MGRIFALSKTEYRGLYLMYYPTIFFYCYSVNRPPSDKKFGFAPF